MILIHPIQNPKAQNILSYTSFMLLLYIAFTLVMSIPLNSVGIILFAVSVLLTQGIKGMYHSFTRKHFYVIIFYLMHAVGYFYSSNVENAGFELEKKLSLIIFPLFLGAMTLKKEHVNYIIFSFVLSCFLMLGYLMMIAIIKLYIFDTNKYFLIGRLPGPVGIHRVYFSMYLVFGIVASIYLIKSQFSKFKYGFIAAILMFSIGIFLMSARMCFLIYIILAVRYLYYYFFVEKKYWMGILVIAIAGASLATIVTNKIMMDKLTQIYTGLDKGNSKRNTSSANLRVIKWKSALEVFQSNFLIGVGTGDVNDELVKEYTRKNFYWGIRDKYNAHNQYLETAIALGITGLVVWLLNLALPFYTSFMAKEYLYAEFIFIFSFCCLTESMLCAQKGVVFYAFFNSLFLFHLMPKEKRSNTF